MLLKCHGESLRVLESHTICLYPALNGTGLWSRLLRGSQEQVLGVVATRLYFDQHTGPCNGCPTYNCPVSVLLQNLHPAA